jgi:hypothetical protein
MTKFSEIPTNIKAAVSLLILGASLFVYHDQFITEVEASQSARIQWINDVEAELRNLNRLLRKERDPDEREALAVEIEHMTEKLKCLKSADDDKVQYC